MLVNNAFWSLVSHVLQRGSVMLGAILLARGLSPSEFAAYSYFQMTASMLATYAAMGLGTTASRFFAEVGHTPQAKLPPLGMLLGLSMVMPVLSFLLIMALPAGWLNGGLSVSHWMIALGVAITVGGIVPGGGILGLEKYRTATLVSLFSAISMLLLVLIAVDQKNTSVAMWSLVAALAVQMLGQLLVVIHATGWRSLRLTFRWSREDLRAISGFAGPMFIVSILAGSASWIVGRVILAGTGEHEFAVFSIGLQWLALGLLLPGMVSRVVLPRLVRSPGVESKRLVRAAIMLALIPAVFLLVLGTVLAPWLMSLYGQAYRQAYWVIPAFLLVAVINAAINTIGNAIVARGGQMNWLWMTISWFVCLIVVLILLPGKTTLWMSAAYGVAALFLLMQSMIYAQRHALL